jgi:hypothetical protein
VRQLVERHVGRWLHGRLVAAPAAHAALLDQYRAAEEYQKRFPKTVCPHLLPASPIRDKYIKHQADETVHEQIFATRIRELGGAPSTAPPERDYLLTLSTELMRAGCGIPPERYEASEPFGTDELARLFAFQTVTEERGVVEMELHRDACVTADPRTHGFIERILRDERFHVEYSRQAYDEVSPGGSVLELCGKVEAAVYARVTARFLDHLAKEGLGLSRFSRMVLGFLARISGSRTGRFPGNAGS